MLIIDDIRSTVSQSAPAYDIEKVYLFGSYARNEATEQSDVDLCLETGPSFSLFNAGDFSNKLRESLGVSVDVATERSLHDFVRKGFLKDRVLLYERT